MYVKLAFSVAAHLDSEIMIMDEVLAVGDMAFQKKCLTKMRDAAQKEGRTVLYVSHNMNTIRQLCNRCVVLDKGKVVFEGDVEDAIGVYMNQQMNESVFRRYEDYVRPQWLRNARIKILEAEFVGKDNVVFEANEPIRIRLKWQNLLDVKDIGLRVELLNTEDVAQATYVLYDMYSGEKGQTGEISFEMDSSMVMDAEYKTFFTFFNKNDQGVGVDLDCVPGLCFRKSTTMGTNNWVWRPKYWGYIQLPSPKILK